MSRQAEYRKRHKAQGLCIYCPLPMFKSQRCVKHYEKYLGHGQRKHIAACCGRVGRLTVELYQALKHVAQSDHAPEIERASARAFLARAYNEVMGGVDEGRDVSAGTIRARA